jgi:hypothetical protein
MKIIPQWQTNIKYWRMFNEIVFGSQLVCPKCSHIEMKENYRRRYLWCKYCRSKHRYSASHGAFLYGCKLQPIQLYQLLWCFVNRMTIETARTTTSLSYTSIERWMNRFRQNLPFNTKDESKLSGIVKIDESFFGKQRSKQAQVIVVGAIEADTGRIRLQIIPDREQETLEGFILQNVEIGSVIVTDYWLGYIGLDDLGYEHYPFNHSKGEFAHTNQIESLWAEIKKYMRRTQGNVLTGKLDLILNEWMVRRNRPELFEGVEQFLQGLL